MSVIKCLNAGVQAAHDVTHAFFINVLIAMDILEGQNRCNLIIEFNYIFFFLFFKVLYVISVADKSPEKEAGPMLF